MKNKKKNKLEKIATDAAINLLASLVMGLMIGSIFWMLYFAPAWMR